MVIQDDEETEGIIVDVSVDPIRKTAPNALPVVFVRYQHNTKASISAAAVDSINKTVRQYPSKAGQIRTPKSEISQLKALLDKNAELLKAKEDSCGASDLDQEIYKSSLFTRSFVTPLPATQKDTICPMCEQPARLNCSRCRKKVESLFFFLLIH